MSQETNTQPTAVEVQTQVQGTADETNPSYEFQNTLQAKRYLKAGGYEDVTLGRMTSEKFGEANVKLLDGAGQIICNVSKKVSDAFRDGEITGENFGGMLSSLCISMVRREGAINPKTGKEYEAGLPTLHHPGMGFDADTAIKVVL